jgi:uncharacterized protein YkwD
MRLRLLLVVLLALSGCAARTVSTIRPAPGAPTVVVAPPRGVPTYDTGVSPGAARGSGDAPGIERALLALAKERGFELTGDGRLASLGDYILTTYVAAGQAPSPRVIDAASRRLGLVDPLPFYSLFTARDAATLKSAIVEMFDSVPKNMRFNRYGIVAQENADAIVLSKSGVELSPVVRRAEPGQTLVLKGTLRQGIDHPRLDVTMPDGSAKSLGQGKTPKIDFSVRLASRGIYRIELLADGPFGLEVVANFPVFVGVPEPESVAGADGEGMDASAGEGALVQRLLVLLNDERKRAGAPEVKLHDGLSAMALTHSRDMVEHGFFGHTSPTYGDPLERAKRASLAFPSVAENIARGGTAEEVNTMLLDSPGHRQNALNPDWSMVGIGVAIDKSGRQAKLVVTEDFSGATRPIDTSLARARVVEAINQKRTSAGAPKLVVDATLAALAQVGAGRFIAEPSLNANQVLGGLDELVDRETKKRPSPLAKIRAVQCSMVVLSSIDQVPTDKMLDPAVRLVGVGVAQGTRPETGPNTIAVVVVIGWPR